MNLGLGLPLTGRGVKGAGGGSLLSQATSQLGGVTPYHYWDFVNNRALFAQTDVGRVASTPGWSFARASTGYAETAAGVLVPFASEELRRTDKGVLIEGARTNLCLRSQEFDDVTWSKTRSSVIANAIAAPDGTLTADKIVEDHSNNDHRFQRTVTLVASTTYTTTIYAKAAERNTLTLWESISGTLRRVDFTLAGAGSGVATLGLPFTIQALANGWYRCSITATDNGTASGVIVYMSLYNGGFSYQGDGTSGLYVWGAQLEAASFPSSYIPTTTASATRAQDVLTIADSRSAPFGIFGEITVPQIGVQRDVLAYDTTVNGTGLYIGATEKIVGWVRESSVTTASITSPGTAMQADLPYKAAARFALNDTNAAGQGSAGTADTVNTPPATTTLKFGNSTFAGSYLFGYIRRVAIFNFAPSDAQLTAMTT